MDTENQYDSTPETKKHIEKVQIYIENVGQILNNRAELHDQSKLGEKEKPLFDKYTPLLAGTTYGSQEYQECLKALKPALEHHYQVNRHHPEYFKLWKCPMCESIFKEEDLCPDHHYPKFCLKCVGGHTVYECQLEPHLGIEGMNLVDIIEMLCDWKAASERHDDGDIMKSIEINSGRFNIKSQMKQILINTAQTLF